MSFRQFLANDSRKSKYEYCSLLVELPDNLTDDIISWGFDYVPNEALFADSKDPLFGREDDTHITVIYGIHTDSVREVAAHFTTEKPFECKLGKIDIFTRHKKFDVLIVRVECDGLHRLNGKMRRSLEVTESFPQYVPHVTIAYLKKGAGDGWIGNDTFNGETFGIDKVIFSSRSDEKTPILLGAK